MSREKTVLILGDTHLPWADKDAIDAAISRAARLKPTYIIQIGDLHDNYSFSRFYKSLALGDPAEELRAADESARQLWNKLTKASPNSKRFQLVGNHDSDRLRKLILQAKPELYSIVENFQRARLTFPGVTTVREYRDYLTLNINGSPVVFCHGWLSTTARHLHFFKENVVMGHLHRAEVVYSRQYGDKIKFGMNVGYMGDETAPVFNYTQCVKKDWHTALGWIDYDGARVITL